MTPRAGPAPRYVALLRAINVGGHTVRMDQLRRIFESLGFSKVETFIASGNVLFDSTSKSPGALEKRIEQRLREELGYDVATFVRTTAQLAGVAAHAAFPRPALESATALNVAFLKEALDRKSADKVMALRTDIDEFHVHGREVYWLCRRKQSESTFSNAVLEKTLGGRSTIRGANTVRKMAEKHA